MWFTANQPCNTCPQPTQIPFEAVRLGECGHCGTPTYATVHQYQPHAPAFLFACDCYAGEHRILRATGNAEQLTVLEYT